MTGGGAGEETMWEQRPGHLSRLGSSEKTQGVCYQRCPGIDADLAGEGREACPQLKQQHLPAPEEGVSGFLALLESPALAGCPWRTRPGPRSALRRKQVGWPPGILGVSPPAVASLHPSSPSCFHSDPIVRVQARTGV